jgi:putative membrane protein
MMSGFGLMAGVGWLGMLTMLLFWVGVLALVIWGVSSLFPTQRLTTENDAIEIVQQRFARGELSREEYLQAIETLR